MSLFRALARQLRDPARLLCLGLLLSGFSTLAQAPPSGTIIGNQASATFTDASGQSRSTTSNIVQTIIQLVPGVDITDDTSRQVTPGQQVFLPHTVENIGNGPDRYTLTVANLPGDDFDLTSLQIFADLNGDGVPDDTVPITDTGTLAPGDQFHIVIVGNVPGLQNNGDLARLLVTATSTEDGTVQDTNTDTVYVSENGVINVNKAVSLLRGQSLPAGAESVHTYSLYYTNIGRATVTDLAIVDEVPVGVTYVPNSARWQVTGNEVLTDADADDSHGDVPDTIVYDFDITAPRTVRAVVSQVPPGITGELTYQVVINTGLPAGIIPNVASYEYNDGVDDVGPYTTNRAVITIDEFVFVDIETLPPNPVLTVPQGAVVSWVNPVTNLGNATDTIDISTGSHSYPPTTAFAFFREDGQTPLLDSDGDGVPDVGPLAPGATFNLVTRATLPPSASGDGPYSVQIIATSSNNAEATDPQRGTDVTTDDLQAIDESTVDLTNEEPLGSAGALGAGPGPEVAPVQTHTVVPGESTRFVIHVNNASPTADAYELAVSQGETFATQTIPTGWSAIFLDLAEAQVTKTRTIAAGGSQQVFLEVTVPRFQAPGDFPLYIRARSPGTTVQDIKCDAVHVGITRQLTLVPDNVGQAFPGGSIVYTHLLTNAGNLREGDGSTGSVVTLTLADDLAGWQSQLYWDQNDNGVLDAGDPQVADAAFASGGSPGLEPGESVRLFVKVDCPLTAVFDDRNTTLITATTVDVEPQGPDYDVSDPPAVVQAVDITTTFEGDLEIEKLQAPDVACDGIADSSFVPELIETEPGACAIYQITVTNVGTVDANGVTVYDSIPPYTTYTTFAGVAPLSTTVGSVNTAPSVGSRGPIQVTVGTLIPAQSAVVTFGVKLDE